MLLAKQSQALDVGQWYHPTFIQYSQGVYILLLSSCAFLLKVEAKLNQTELKLIQIIGRLSENCLWDFITSPNRTVVPNKEADIKDRQKEGT